MKIIDEFIRRKEEKSNILELYQLGASWRDIREFIINKFRPFLERKNISEVEVMTFLSQNIDSLQYILSDNKNKNLFENCLKTYWKAKSIDSKKCFESFQYWQEDLLAATSKIVSLINLDHDRSEMNLHDFAEDIFSKIGKIIEKCIKPYLRITLYLESIIAKEKTSIEDIKSMRLGNVIPKLLKFDNYNELLMPAPWNLHLNDWRNICKHDDYDIRDNKIVGRYKEPPDQEEVILLKQELWKLFDTVNDLFTVLKLSNTVFFFDNLIDIKKFWKNMPLRKESYILDAISLFITRGFSVEDYSINNKEVSFEIKDITKKDPKSRLNTILTLLRPVWYKTRAQYIELKYIDFEGKPIFLITTETPKNKHIFFFNIDENILTIDNIKKAVNITDLRSS